MSQISASQISALEVFLGQRSIGTIAYLGSRDICAFTFNEDYLQDEQRPTLSLYFKSATGGIIQRVTSRVKLPPFFANLLPEGHLREYLARMNGVHPDREFFLLSALGEDLPGAITVKPLGPIAGKFQDDLDIKSSGQERLRFSLAGVQMKFSALLESEGELTIPAGGVGGFWIVKLPAANLASVPENEFSMMLLAKAVGITIPELMLVDTAKIDGIPQPSPLSGKSLAVRRFDRLDNGQKIHIEDFAQVFGEYPHDKYENHSYANIATVLYAESADGDKDLQEFVRRLVFMLATGNTDMHLKNWSLIYPDGRAARLAPAYDYVSTVAYVKHSELGLSLGGARDMREVEELSFDRFAKSAGVPSGIVRQTVSETLERFFQVWNRTKDAVAEKCSMELVASIDDLHGQIPLLRDYRDKLSAKR